VREPCAAEDPARLLLRTATEAELPAIRALIAASVRHLQPEYAAEQREQALLSVFTPDTQLIADRTYYTLATAAGAGGELCTAATTTLHRAMGRSSIRLGTLRASAPSSCTRPGRDADWEAACSGYASRQPGSTGSAARRWALP
jgi:hypothetical protein